MFYLSPCFRKIPFTILLLGSLACTSFAHAFNPIDIRVVFNITWDGPPSQTETNLGMSSTTDTWTTRFTIFNSAIPVAKNCHKGKCTSWAYATERDHKNISARVQSTTEPNLSLMAFRHHSLRSFDEFDYFSDAAGASADYVSFIDVVNGSYVAPGASQMENWILERSMFGLNANGQITASSPGLVQFLNSGNATFEVQEYFSNNLQQLVYSKTGTATVSSVLVITPQNNPYPLECKYTVVSDWGHGYQSLASLKNVGNTAVNNWLVTLKFSDMVYVDSYWNAAIVGFIPDFVAASVSGNHTIYPGQEVNFGLIGSKATSQTANAFITGKLCR